MLISRRALKRSSDVNLKRLAEFLGVVYSQGISHDELVEIVYKELLNK